MPEKLKKFAPSIIMPVIFETVAVVLTVTPDNISYLFNFTCIGVFIAKDRADKVYDLWSVPGARSVWAFALRRR